MYCKKCGMKLSEGVKYCPKCGEVVYEEETVNIDYKKKTTFKDGIVALFNKIFLFEGRSGQAEFNYGLLFLMIVSTVLSSIAIYPTVAKEMNIINSFTINIEEIANITLEFATSRDIFNSVNLYGIAMSLIFAIFLSAPVYRRLTDIGISKKLNIVFTIIFIAGEILCGSLLYCLLPTNIYTLIVPILDVLSLGNLAVLLFCVFKRTKLE